MSAKSADGDRPRPTSDRRPILPSVAALALFAIAGVGGVWATDDYFGHGYRVSWEAEHEEEMVPVTTTVEHRPAFANEHRPISRVVEAWDYDEFGVPEHLFRFHATFEATLTVPEGGRYLRADGSGDADVFVDHQKVGETTLLEAGDHSLRIAWRGDFRRATHFRLLWNPEENEFRRVPAQALRPWGSAAAVERIAADVAVGVLALLLAIGVVVCLRTRDRGARGRRWAALALACVALWGLGLRSWDYAAMPAFEENGDELFAAWNGHSLLTEGRTVGWSLWPEFYGNMVEHEALPYWGMRPWQLIRPYLEHPPLLHLLAGGAARLGGAQHFSHAKLTHTRLVPILLFLPTLWLIYAIGVRLLRRRLGPVLGALLYAGLPLIALQTRVVKEEVLLVPMTLASIWLYLRWRDDGERTKHLVLAGLVAAACVMVKLPGAFFVPALIMVAIADRRGHAVRTLVLTGALGAIALVAYAAIIDWDLFWFTTRKQATLRAIHWDIFARLFTDPHINHNKVGEGTLLFLWFGYVATAWRLPRPTRAAFIVPPLLYLLMIGISSGNWTYGWYLMPVYPFLCLGAGELLAETWRRPSFLAGLLIVALLTLYLLNFTVVDIHVQRLQSLLPATRRFVTWVCLGLVLPFLAAGVFRGALSRGLARLSLVACLLTTLAAGAIFVARYDVVYETHRDLDRMEFYDN